MLVVRAMVEEAFGMSASQYLFTGTAFLMGLLLLAVIGRLIMGPTIADRVVAFDVFNTLLCMILLLLAAAYDSVVMVDLAIVYYALFFVCTLYFSRYIEGGV